MANKDKKEKFQTFTDDHNLSAGICGPDGCVLDWSKQSKKEKKNE